MTDGELVIGPRVVGGESDGGARYATLDGAPVVVKWAALEARPRFEAVAALLERLARRGLPAPAYRLLDRDGALVVAQTVLPGEVDGSAGRATVDAVLAASELLADVERVPMLDGLDWPALLQHSLTVGEDGWCRHEPMRAWSARTRAIVEHAEAIGAALDPASVPASDCVHLDLHPGNMLMTGDRLTGIFDWDGALPGDRWFDLVFFAFCVDVWRDDTDVTGPVWAAVEAAVAPGLLAAYAAHTALRFIEWNVSRHTPADVERWLGWGERLVARYPA